MTTSHPSVATAATSGRRILRGGIDRRPPGREAPLSFAQQRLWFLDQQEPDSPAYIITGAFRIMGPLDVEILGQALSEIAQRHEVLRTVFPVAGGEARQVVVEAIPVRLSVEDLVSAPDIPLDVERIMTEESRRRFDLQRGPIMRWRLLRLAPQGHLLVLAVHHIAMDGLSMGVLWQELAALYRCFVAGQASPLPRLQVQYADYSLWQRARLDGARAQRQIDWWRRYLDGAPPLLELPTDRPRSSVQSFAGDTVAFGVDRQTTEDLKSLGRHNNATLFMTALAAFQTLLSLYAATDDVVIGVVSANRLHRQVRNLIGFFVNTVVIRTSFQGDPRFVDLLARVRTSCTGAMSNQDIPFERVVEELAPRRAADRTPLAQVLFQLQQFDFRGVAGPRGDEGEVVIERFALDAGAGSKFDLSMALAETGDGLKGRITYRTDLFERRTIERFAGHFRQLLASVVAHCDQPVSTLQVLLPDEQQRLLVDLNDTAVDLSAESTIEGWLARHAVGRPEATALVDVDGARISYAALDARVDRLARWLLAKGQGEGSVVGVIAPRDASLVVALLAVMRAGAAYLPLSPAHPAERLRWMLDDAGAAMVLVVGADLVASVEGAGAVAITIGDAERESTHLAGRCPSVARPDGLAYVMYTSGSTGQPKGVEVRHRQLVNYFAWVTSTGWFESGDGAPLHGTVAFVGTLTGLFGPLVAGSTLWLVPGDDTFGLGQFLAGHRDLSMIKLTPSKLALLSAQRGPDQLAGSARVVMTGGEPLVRTAAIESWLAADPELRIVSQYGSTECVGCCTARLGDDVATGAKVPIGTPIANCRVYVLGPRRQPVPIGVTGELYVGGDVVARGYRGRPAETAERFVADPFTDDPGARLYRTGDLARYRDDGVIEYVGRADHQVTVRGYRVECGEVEAVLRARCGAEDAVVVQRQPGAALTAYVVVGDPSPPDLASGIRSEARRYLPDYMIPAEIFILPSFPLTVNGKVDRTRLPLPGTVDESAGASSAHAATATIVGDGQASGPAGALERQLLAIWRDVLGRGDIGVDDNFFDLGGDSFASVQIVALADEAGLAVEITDLFTFQSVAELARGIGQRDQGVG